MAYEVEYTRLNDSQWLATFLDRSVIVTEEDLRKWKKTINSILPKDKIQIGYIMDVVCSGFNVEPKYMFKDIRTQDIVRPRQVFFYFAALHTGLTLNAIGAYPKASGYTDKAWDHATVLYSRDSVIDAMDVNPKERSIIEAIEYAIEHKEKPGKLEGSFGKAYFNSDNITIA